MVEASTPEEREARKYFQPFDTLDEYGREYTACGFRLAVCKTCQRRYKPEDRLLRACPECGRDRRCIRPAVAGFQRCNSHRQRRRERGALHRNYKHGRQSLPIAFPPDLQQAYLKSLKAMDTRNVYGEMAIFVTRINQLAERLSPKKESDARWKKLGDLAEKTRNASKNGDEDAVNRNMNAILEIAQKGASESERWRELLQLTKDLASLKQVQAGIRKDYKAYLGADDAMVLMGTMAAAVREGMAIIYQQWKQLERLLSEQELDDLATRLGVADDAEFVQWRERLPVKDMSGSFKTADINFEKKIYALVSRRPGDPLMKGDERGRTTASE